MNGGVGGKIKMVASILCVIEVLGAIIGGISIMTIDEYMVGIGFIVLITGILLSAVTYLLLYGFGELIDDVKEIKGKISGLPVAPEITKEAKQNAVITNKINNPEPLKKRVPYWCKACGQEGPYVGNCPNCGAVEIRYE